MMSFSVVLIKSLFVKFNIFVKDRNVSDISSQNFLDLYCFFLLLFEFFDHVRQYLLRIGHSNPSILLKRAKISATILEYA